VRPYEEYCTVRLMPATRPLIQITHPILLQPVVPSMLENVALRNSEPAALKKNFAGDRTRRI
jgi:hypothetical protein